MPRVFDGAELLERVDNDWEFLGDTVRMLEADGPALLEEIRRSADAGDAASAGRAAHTLKGMISNFCAPDAQVFHAFTLLKTLLGSSPKYVWDTLCHSECLLHFCTSGLLSHQLHLNTAR